MKLLSVTCQPGTHSPQVINAADVAGLERLEPSGDVMVREAHAKGKQRVTIIRSWLSARAEIDVPEPSKAPAKGGK